jgi:hypothetical protein
VGSASRSLGVLLLRALAALALVAAFPSGTAEADELLVNGGFDSTSGWSGNRFAVPGVCTGRNGSAATLTPDNANLGLLVQSVKVNGSAGPFVFSGWLKL